MNAMVAASAPTAKPSTMMTASEASSRQKNAFSVTGVAFCTASTTAAMSAIKDTMRRISISFLYPPQETPVGSDGFRMTGVG
jgi:hypothetical protein